MNDLAERASRLLAVTAVLVMPWVALAQQAASVGGGFDTSPMSKSNRSPNLPLDQQYRLGTGLRYSFNDKITVGAAYQYMNGGDADIDVERGPLAGRLEGDYKSYDFHFFALNLSWRL